MSVGLEGMRWTCAIALLVAATAFAAPAVDPSGPGPFAAAVTRVDLIDADRARTIRTEIWYPGATATRDAPFVHGRFPLIVFAHGLCGSRLDYQYLTEHLAEHGFVVAAPDIRGYFAGDCAPDPEGTPRPDDPSLDLSFVRNAFRDGTAPLAAFRRIVRGPRAGIAGHSLGGLWAQQTMLRDRLFTAVALLAPVPGVRAEQIIPRPRRSILVFGGTDDALLPYDPVQTDLFDVLPAPSFLVKVVDGTHDGFTDADPDLQPEELARQQAIVVRYAGALFTRYLGGRRGFARYLNPEDARQFGDDLALSARLRAR